jgi:hypothetical protein
MRETLAQSLENSSMKIDHWFTAIVENIADPLNAGRVQIRCYEYHELDDANSIPSEKLPWATPLLPITSASNSAVGASATGLMVGSWVFGFFRDEDLQDPVIIATIPGTTNLSGGGDIPQDAISSSVGNSFVSGTNVSQYVDGSPIANSANTSALDGAPAAWADEKVAKGAVDSFVNDVLNSSQ